MGRRVLLVDDNADLTTMMRELLELAGHAVYVENDGAQALASARSFAPDLVLLDLGLPGRDGYQVARDLRSDPAFKDCDLVALTGYGSDDFLERSRDAGFDAHITKPLGRQQLYALMEWHHPPR
jgi:CheY-like chemotaxis protein